MSNKNKMEPKTGTGKEIVKISSYRGYTTLHNVSISRIDEDSGARFVLSYDQNKRTFVRSNTVFGGDLKAHFDELKLIVFDLTFSSFTGFYDGKDYNGHCVREIKKVADRTLSDEPECQKEVL